MIAKRYSIFNMYVGGSNILPQGFHGLNSLWSNKDSMTPEAQKLFEHWAKESEVEVVLKGGDDNILEALYLALSKIPEIPSAKFNEPGMRQCCTIVTFVASDKIVAAGLQLRNKRILPHEAESYLSVTEIIMPNGNVMLTANEIFVAANIAYLPLVS